MRRSSAAVFTAISMRACLVVASLALACGDDAASLGASDAGSSGTSGPNPVGTSSGGEGSGGSAETGTDETGGSGPTSMTTGSSSSSTTGEGGATETGQGPRCEQDEYVEAGACQMCPEGWTNEAGDDPAGPDTVCDDACAQVFGVDCAAFDESYLKASNPDGIDNFGWSVAVDADTLVVGAPNESSGATGVDGDQFDDSPATNASGAAYVFVRTDGVWSQQAYIKPSNTPLSRSFGWSLDLSGDTLAVGAFLERGGSTGVDGDDAIDAGNPVGAVYVFQRSGTQWSQQAYIKGANSGIGDRFGVSVSLEGDLLAVGASGEASAAGADPSSNAAPSAGAVYVFERDGTQWSQQAYLKASNPDTLDSFGLSVGLSGDTLAVGAAGEDSAAVGIDGDQDDDSLASSGAVYVFERGGNGSWVQQAYIKASDPDAQDVFGQRVSLHGDVLAVTAPQDASAATGVDGDASDDSAPMSGAVYVFERDGQVWSQEAYLKASNTQADDGFGAAVAVHGNQVVVGANREDGASTGLGGDQSNGLQDSGAAYVFERAGGGWAQAAYLKAPTSDVGDAFGRGLALSATTLVVGVGGEDSASAGVGGDQEDDSLGEAGAAYVFRIAPR